VDVVGLILNSLSVNDLYFQDRGYWVICSDCCRMRDGCLHVVSEARGSQPSIGRSDFKKEVTCVLADHSFGIQVLERESFERAAERLTNVGWIETTILFLNCASRITSVKGVVVSIVAVCCAVYIGIDSVPTYINAFAS
jgi:hypothetical protein